MTVLLGSQEPRILNRPEGVVGSYGPETIDLARLAGLELDSWQKLYVDGMLSINEGTYWNKYSEFWESTWAASTCGLVVARQNGKGGILEARELCSLFICRDSYIIHSAHEHDTAQEAHVRLMSLIESVPDLERQVSRAPMGHGEQGVELKTNKKGVRGPRMRFRTRTSGGGRGFTADLVVLDEAMKLEEAFTGALIPTLSARPNPQVLYTGSAGNDKAVAFSRVRDLGMNGDPETFYAEWSVELCDAFCSPGCTEHIDPDSEEAVALTNPAYGIRITPASVRRERGVLSAEEFARERLSVGTWPTNGVQWATIPEAAWRSRENGYSELITEKGFVLGIDTAPDSSMSCIVAVGANDVGDTHVEITVEDGVEYDYRPGTQWVIPRALQIARTAKPRYIVIDKATPAGDFIEELEKGLVGTGIEIIIPNSREYAQSCGKFLSGVKPKRGETAFITHIGQEPLDNAVMVAQQRTIADMWGWSKKDSKSDIAPLVAATIAMWGYKKYVFASAPAVAPWVRRR